VQDVGGGAIIGAESSESIPTSGRRAVADEVAPRAVSPRAFGSAQANKDLREHGRAANHVQAETAPFEDVPGNFFAHTAPRQVSVSFENAPSSVPERIVSKLQLNPFGKPGTPESVKEAPHVDTEPVTSPMPAERCWRGSTRAALST